MAAAVCGLAVGHAAGHGSGIPGRARPSGSEPDAAHRNERAHGSLVEERHLYRARVEGRSRGRSRTVRQGSRETISGRPLDRERPDVLRPEPGYDVAEGLEAMTPAEAERVAEVLAATVNAVKMHVDSESAVVFVEEVAKGMARKTFPDFEWPALL